MERLSILARRLLITLSVLLCPLILQAQIPHNLVQSIPAPDGAAQTGGQLGYSVAVDGDYTVTGVPYDDTRGLNSGVVKVFHSVTGALLFVLNNPSPSSYDYFGYSVAISGTRVVVGAYGDDTGATDAGSAYVYDLSSATPNVPVAVLTKPFPVFGEYFGWSVAISGTRVVVGASVVDETGAENAGRAYVYELTNATPTVPIATLKNPTPAADDKFGSSVAISGTRIVVGSSLDDTGATDAGSAYIYDLSSATPTVPTATLNNPAPAADDNFGLSFAISGTQVVIGAFHDDTGAANAGSAYVYELNSATPTVPTATLNKPTPAADDNFGNSVAISGTQVVVGASREDTGATDAGSAYVYELTGATPTVPIATLNKPAPGLNDGFGYAVAISGTRVVVGAPLDNTGATDAGSAYVYELSLIPNVPVATLNHPGLASSDYFGRSVAISGSRIVVGAYRDNTVGTSAGIAHVFDLTSATPTVPIFTLNSPPPADGDNFGYSVAISGAWVVVGAPRDATGASSSGSAYVYDLSSATPTVPMATLNNPTPANLDLFGYSVAISGTSVVVGATNDDTGASNAGSAYVYELNSGTPAVPIATLNTPTPAAGDNFGHSVAISGTKVVIGAPGDDTGASGAGGAYVYELTSGTPTEPIATLYKPSPASGDGFGWSVAISGTRVVVGAFGDNTGTADAGSAHVYDLTSGTPTVPTAKLNNPTPASSDWFGWSVAISGTRVAVGAYQDDTGATDAGSAYVYELTSATPTVPLSTLNNPSPAFDDAFGISVAISGTTIAIGTPYEDSVMGDKGSAYIYEPTTSPDIAVSQAGPLTEGGTVSFGNVKLGSSSAPRTFTISNPGTDTLSNLVITSSTGEFTVSNLSGTSIPVGSGTVTFTVTFTPSAGGSYNRTATLHLASNVTGDKNPFDIQLVGYRNSQPTFSGYTLQTTQGTPAKFPLATLFARTADEDGGTFYLISVSATSTQGGSVSAGPSVSLGGFAITYTPPANFTGLDTFSVTIGDGQGGSVEGNVMVVVTANGAPMGKLPMIMLQPSGKVAILFDGIPSQGYRIERSPDLLNWSPLQTTTAPTDGMLPYFDINPLPGQGFYRRIPQ